jgi:cytochrome bd ubiquinol oxidase subunit II
MDLNEIPLILMVAGLAAYGVLAGADFGAGFWSLLAGSGEQGRAVREQTHRSIGPVWEANHVWLIFVLAVCWTAYPTAFASIVSTLSIPLFVAAIGIIMRGTAYALHNERAGRREERLVNRIFSLSSIITPLALGAVVGGIASGRVPVGNAEGDLLTSWANATSAVVGVLAVATATYLAAVFLAADATRTGDRELARAFRTRALAAGVLAGALGFAALPIIHEDAPDIWDGLTSGAGLAAVLVSAAAGVATIGLVLRNRFEAARYSAALAVAAVVVGWPLAQSPEFLPGLTVDEAAAGDATIEGMLVTAAIGMFVLAPSLFLLFRLVLRGRFDPGAERAEEPAPAQHTAPRVLVPVAIVSGTIGVLFTFLVDRDWAPIIGVPFLLTFIAAGALYVVPSAVEEESPAGTGSRS